jgi:hypothetical protein
VIRVYQYGVRPPIEAAELVESQLRAAHNYRNDLVSVERGRRSAVRATHDTTEVRERIDELRAATRSSRIDALRALDRARRRAEAQADSDDMRSLIADVSISPDVEQYDLSALDPAGSEMARIRALDGSIRRDARALTTCYWGSYLTIEASADQSRKAPLYDDDGATPADPRFVRWRGEGQIGVQLQGGLAVSRLLAGDDTRLRWTEGVLWMRVGSEGHAPIWAKFQVTKHRELPDAGTIKWARVSRRNEGPYQRWTCEFTVDCPAKPTRITPGGAIALELLWSTLDDGSMRVGVWRDSSGDRGEIILSARDVAGVRKSDGIRSVRDQLLNDLRPKLARMIAESRDDVPPWLREAGANMQYWKSQERFHGLVDRWRWEKCDAARDAYELLDAWWLRDRHLWEYEACGRRQALRRRRERYRVLAAEWSRKYESALVPDRDLSREARWGEDSDRRFTAAPQELRDCMRHAFGPDTHEVAWRGPHGVIDDGDEDSDPPEWLDFAIEQWRDGKLAVGARKSKKTKAISGEKGGAWARRKQAKLERGTKNEGARNAAGKAAE